MAESRRHCQRKRVKGNDGDDVEGMPLLAELENQLRGPRGYRHGAPSGAGRGTRRCERRVATIGGPLGVGGYRGRVAYGT